MEMSLLFKARGRLAATLQVNQVNSQHSQGTDGNTAQVQLEAARAALAMVKCRVWKDAECGTMLGVQMEATGASAGRACD